tara:strand:- start:1043 stop:1576 length:534 start_codon:yes stop_codon:yes gene_type:complete
MIDVVGADEVSAALMGLTGRARQNIERKAARASLNKLKLISKAAWKSTIVGKASKPAKYSIRKNAAKSLFVKVNTRGMKATRMSSAGDSLLGFSLDARLAHNYNKKNAGRAKLAHLLEEPHKTGKSGVNDGYSSGGTRTMANVFSTHARSIRGSYMKAVMLWIMRPKATQKQARGQI